MFLNIYQGVLDRGASIRVGRETEKDGKGTLLDHMHDNYKLMRKIVSQRGNYMAWKGIIERS